LNGASASFAETLALLSHDPDSLSSDNPRRQRATLSRIANQDLPTKLSDIVEISGNVRIEKEESGLGARAFLNRDYQMRGVPGELEGMSRIAFDGGAGGSVTMKFKKSGCCLRRVRLQRHRCLVFFGWSASQCPWVASIRGGKVFWIEQRGERSDLVS
jgi:hypothetical protein